MAELLNIRVDPRSGKTATTAHLLQAAQQAGFKVIMLTPEKSPQIQWFWAGDKRLILWLNGAPVLEIRKDRINVVDLPPFGWFLYNCDGTRLTVTRSGQSTNLWDATKAVAQHLAEQHVLAERTLPPGRTP